MLTLEETHRNGQIILSEVPQDLEEAKVLVTFLQPQAIDLTARDINRKQAAILRSKLNAIADDWNDSEMNVYDVD